MIARLQKSMKEKDQGFTLIELLVVMIIIGILAAIAIPVFLNQRKKAVDTAAKADVSTIGKEVATWYVDGDVGTVPALAAASGRYTLATGDIGKQSSGMLTPTLAGATAAQIAAGDTNATAWCVTLPYTGGTSSPVYYSAKNGLSSTSC
jgi:type IV pilus assembly protein PilA